MYGVTITWKMMKVKRVKPAKVRIAIMLGRFTVVYKIIIKDINMKLFK